ncbi:MAG: helix-turn-helix domain-containing protein [Candidatus Dadabacteria bacterium]|nr:helix-turn-helix domain-containing protein [Candidatus Dadabacteria bacterium]
MSEIVVKKYLSIDEASKTYSLTKSTLYKLSALRRIPLIKLGSRVLIPVADFEKWLDAHRVDREDKRR